MLKYWSSRESNRNTADDTRTLSLHVLSFAGFGKSYVFQGHQTRQSSHSATSYKASLQTILDNAILLMVLGQHFLSKSWLPAKLQRLHEAVVTFKRYMTEVYEDEKQSIAKGRPGEGNLMTSLVRASLGDGNAQEIPEGGSQTSTGLTETEVYGNIFVFNFAGHDTISSTLHFAILMLAISPTVQSWLSEEIKYVVGTESPEDWDYQATFPRLKRCLAVMVMLPHSSLTVGKSVLTPF